MHPRHPLHPANKHHNSSNSVKNLMAGRNLYLSLPNNFPLPLLLNLNPLHRLALVMTLNYNQDHNKILFELIVPTRYRQNILSLLHWFPTQTLHLNHTRLKLHQYLPPSLHLPLTLNSVPTTTIFHKVFLNQHLLHLILIVQNHLC